ncbi:MAG: DUF4823 domain-containing protein [Endomicrobium sp.]|jgi:hypothetical protein|nr:DUF4823 domain-containing protein [Endomicrobium sp.]
MKKVLSLCLLLFCGFVLQACTPAYKIDNRASKNLGAAKPVLKPSDKIAIIMPADGKYKRLVYPQTGLQVAEKLIFAFRKYTGGVSLVEQVMSIEAAKSYAKQNGFKHIVYPEIIKWEDRMTAVSGKRDRVSIHMTVFDVDNNKTVDDCIIYGNGSLNVWASAKTPEILLEEPFSIYTAMLFGAYNK